MTIETAAPERSTPKPASQERARVLIVSDTPFSEFHGLGVTLTNFFEGWPADKLALLCSAWSPMAQMEQHRARCSRTHPFRLPGPGGRLDWVKYRLGFAQTWRDEPSKAWHRAWFFEWRPDVIYSAFVDLNTLAYADWLAQFLKVPHVCHITDDVTPGIAVFGLRRFREIVARAARRVAISDEMKLRYEGLTDAEFSVLHNGAKDYALAPPMDRGNILVIRYLGSVSIVQHAALADIAVAVRRSNDEGIPCRLEIAGSFWDAALEDTFVDGEFVRKLGSYLPADEWARLMATADLLLIPIAFDPGAAIDVRLSLPTKLLDCLGSGTPVLIYGPPDAAPCRFCRANGFGTVIDARDATEIVQLLHSVAAHPAVYRERARRDRLAIRRKFSSPHMTRRFQLLLSDAAAQR